MAGADYPGAGVTPPSGVTGPHSASTGDGWRYGRSSTGCSSGASGDGGSTRDTACGYAGTRAYDGSIRDAECASSGTIASAGTSANGASSTSSTSASGGSIV